MNTSDMVDAQFDFKGRVVKSYSNEVAPIAAACVSPDDAIVVSCHKEKIMLWDLNSTESIGKLEGHRADISCCSMNDILLATGSLNGIVHLWKYRDLKRVARIGLPLSPINALGLSPNGQHLSVAYADGNPRIYTIYSGDGSLLQGPSYKELLGHTDSVTDMKFSSNGLTILTASKDGSVRLWKALTGELLHTVDPGEGAVTSCGFSGGSNIAFLTEQGITIWSLNEDTLVWKIEGRFQLMATSNTTHAIASVTPNGRLCCFNVAATRETVKKGTAHADEISACVACSSGRNFITGGADAKLFLWE